MEQVLYEIVLYMKRDTFSSFFNTHDLKVLQNMQKYHVSCMKPSHTSFCDIFWHLRK